MGAPAWGGSHEDRGCPDLTTDHGLVLLQHGRNPALAMTRFYSEIR